MRERFCQVGHEGEVLPGGSITGVWAARSLCEVQKEITPGREC